MELDAQTVIQYVLIALSGIYTLAVHFQQKRHKNKNEFVSNIKFKSIDNNLDQVRVLFERFINATDGDGAQQLQQIQHLNLADIKREADDTKIFDNQAAKRISMKLFSSQIEAERMLRSLAYCDTDQPINEGGANRVSAMPAASRNSAKNATGTNVYDLPVSK